MADVFISYRRDDRAMVERLSSALRQLGFEVWWDFELLSGDSFRKVIRAVIDQCAVAVVLWSRRSTESSFVLDEANYAQRLGKLCPVRIDDVELPLGFGQLHAIDLSGWEGELSHPGFERLVKALEGRVGRRVRLGASEQPGRQTEAAELEAFKAAELGGSISALRSFTASFPNSVFAAFIRDQIESIEAERRSMRGTVARSERPETPPTPADSEHAGRASSSAASTAPQTMPRRLLGWKLVLSVALLTAIAIGFYLFIDAQQRTHEQAQIAREQAEAARRAAEERARLMEEQAAAERVARERAEKARAELLQRQASQAAFNLSALHPDVRAAAESARRNARAAEAAAERARTAANAAENAAERARRGAPGTISLAFDGGTYLGEGSGSTRSGVGVTSFHAPSRLAGDRYAGEFRENARSGVGVSSFGTNPGNASNALRREGEYAANKADGMGVLYWASGDRYQGVWRQNIKSGPAVMRFADGRRYEGGFAADKRNGHGVLWLADGQVLSVGLWKDGVLVKSLKP